MHRSVRSRVSAPHVGRAGEVCDSRLLISIGGRELREPPVPVQRRSQGVTVALVLAKDRARVRFPMAAPLLAARSTKATRWIGSVEPSAPTTRTQGANADCNPAEAVSNTARVSLRPLRNSARRSKPRQRGSTPRGRARSRSSRRLRKPGSHPGNAGSNSARDARSLLEDERRCYERRLAGSIPARDATCSRPRSGRCASEARWLLFDSARERCGRVKRFTHWAHNPRNSWFDSSARYGDNARRDVAFIRPAAVVRVHVSPLRDRLLARITKL